MILSTAKTMSFNRFVCLIISLFSALANAEEPNGYKLISKTNTSQLYLIGKPVTNGSGVTNAKIVRNWNEPQTKYGITYPSQLEYLQIKCDSQTEYRLTALVMYSELFAKGNKLQETDFIEAGDDKWSKLQPGTQIDAIAKLVCAFKSSPDQDKIKPNIPHPDDFLKELKKEEAKIQRAKEEKLRLQAGKEAHESKTQSVASIFGSKIRSNVILPAGIEGNPPTTLRVSLLPNGEVISVDIIESSNNSKLDKAIERAIFKSSPLPVPEEGKIRSLTIKYYPFANN